MDGIALESWNKTLLLHRHRRRVAFNASLELSYTKGLFNTRIAATLLYQTAAQNLETLIQSWQGLFEESWQRQALTNPGAAAEQGENDLLPMLTTEQQHIETEIAAVADQKGISWTPEDLKDGRSLLTEQAAVLKAGCSTRINALKAARQGEIDRQRAQKKTHAREVLHTRLTCSFFTIAGALFGVWVGAALHARHSTSDREFIEQRILRVEEKINTVRQGGRAIQNEVSELRKSNRKIAFWTEKTPQQIDKEIEEANDLLHKQIQDIKEETIRKTARVESEYARSGREGGAELEMRKQGILRMEGKLIEAAEAKTQKKLDELEGQKRNIMR